MYFLFVWELLNLKISVSFVINFVVFELCSVWLMELQEPSLLYRKLGPKKPKHFIIISPSLKSMCLQHFPVRKKVRKFMENDCHPYFTTLFFRCNKNLNLWSTSKIDITYVSVRKNWRENEEKFYGSTV